MFALSGRMLGAGTCFVWLCLCGVSGKGHEKVSSITGHLDPLGSHRPAEGTVDAVADFPSPQDFYEGYVLPSKPLLIKQGAKHIPAFHLWSDEYLRTKYGGVEFEVEMGKKETRKGRMALLPLRNYLEIYKHADTYLVDDADASMKGDLSLLPSLRCGGFQKHILQAVLWFSSGGTKSVLHNDAQDNFNCILDGTKEIFLIDKEYGAEVESRGWVTRGTYSQVNVESVDMHQFPKLRDVPWWTATMSKGDCLFIPLGWYHAVKSSDSRNLAVNLWFAHLMWFNKTDCDKQPPPTSGHTSLEDVHLWGLDSTESLRLDAFSFFEGQDEIEIDDAVDAWSPYLSDEEIQQMFELADANHDLVLTWDEVYNMDMLPAVRTFQRLFGENEEGDEDQLDHDEL